MHSGTPRVPAPSVVRREHILFVIGGAQRTDMLGE